MSLVPIEKRMTSVGDDGGVTIAPSKSLYVLVRDDPTRTIDPDDVEATETLIDVYDNYLGSGSPETQPLVSDAEGGFPYWVNKGEWDLYSPDDLTNPIVPWTAGGGGGPTEVEDSFTDKADGVPVSADSGQAYILEGTHGSTVTVSDGRLVAVPAADNVATYTQVALEGQGNRVGCRFVMNTYTEGNGSMLSMGFWAVPMDSSTGTAVEDSPLHLVVTATSWSIDIWEDGVTDVLQSAFFAEPLTADGETEYSVEAFIDKANGIVYAFLPDGQKILIEDARIATLEANYAFIEHYRDDADGGLPEFVAWWAESQAVAPLAQASMSVSPAFRPVAMTYNPGTLATYTAPTGASADVDATNIALLFVPETDKAIVRVSAVVKFFGNTNYFWTLRILTTTFGSQKLAWGQDNTLTPPQQRFNVEFLVEGLTAGSPVTFKLGHLGTVASSVLRAGGTASEPVVISAVSV